jgi:hypothetical protein
VELGGEGLDGEGGFDEAVDEAGAHAGEDAFEDVEGDGVVGGGFEREGTLGHDVFK